MNPNASNACAICGRESKITCTACSMTWYCSPGCRDKHLWQHKPHCLSLLQKLVERIGETLREIFYVFSERAYTIKISSIAKDTDAVLVSEGVNDLRVSHQTLFSFPADLLPDLRDRQAVLCVGRSEHALGYLHDFIAQMLRGNLKSRGALYGTRSHNILGIPVLKAEEVAVSMLRGPKAAVLSCADEHGNRYVQNEKQRRVLRLVAPIHSKRWTIDPAGSTYGIYAMAMATANYEQSHTDLLQERPRSDPFGYYQEKLRAFAKLEGLVGLQHRVLFFGADRLQLGVDDWTLRSDLTLPQMLRLSDRTFKAQLIFLRTCVYDMMSGLRSSPEYLELIQEALRA